MGIRYRQLSPEERLELHRQHAAGAGVRAIARLLGRNAATISRELRRNSLGANIWRGGYEPGRADRLAQRRRRWDARFKLARQPHLQQQVRQLLAMGWSPEQIAGRLALEQSGASISHESIYRFIYHRSARPPHIDKRKQPGHWEADLLMFSNRKTNLLVAQERHSRFVFIARQENKQAAPTVTRLKDWLMPLPPSLRRSVTQDNGAEFFLHHQLNTLGIKTWFCNPHSPWQKGGIENMNGRIRRYIPLSAKPGSFSNQDAHHLAQRLNHTPRKCLGFKTPAEVFSRHLLLLHFNRESTSQPARE